MAATMFRRVAVPMRAVQAVSVVRRFKSHSAAHAEAEERYAKMSDDDLVSLVLSRKLSVHKLETDLGDCLRGAVIRRRVLEAHLKNEGKFNPEGKSPLDDLPVRGFAEDAFYRNIHGTNCESVIGYVPVPVGVVGPLHLDRQAYRVPMATTEGALIASTNRGCAAIAASGGATSVVTANGMTRAPLIRVDSVAEAAAIKQWIEDPENLKRVTAAFNSTTKYGELKTIRPFISGRNVFLRFAAFTGDAMGMNMVSKGCVAALKVIHQAFPGMHVVSLSGNVCADKKPSAVNWILGRGRSVSVEVVLNAKVVEQTLKTTVDDIIEVNTRKNLVGSSVAGSLGGFNAHAANIVAAVFLATGNDIAQTVESATCMTLLERNGNDLHMSVTMPSIEVGTIGGGTTLTAQKAALAMLGVAGSSTDKPGNNADRLARVVAGTVLAGELSLLAALASGDLVDSHLKLNRKKDAGHAHGQAKPHHAHKDTPTLVCGVAAPVSSVVSFGHPSSGGPMRSPLTHVEWAAPTPRGVRLVDQTARMASGMRAIHTQSSQHLYGEDGPKLPVP